MQVMGTIIDYKKYSAGQKAMVLNIFFSPVRTFSVHANQ